MKSDTVACFIPIKERSTRVPRKNFRLLGDRRLFEYIIMTAVDSNCFDKIYVDTDSDEVSEFCADLKVEVITRDSELSKDTANGNDLMNYWYKKFPHYDYYFQLFVTSPFTRIKTIKECIKTLKQEKYDSVFTAHKKCGWYWFDRIPINYNPLVLPRSQDAKKVFSETTALYGINKQALHGRRCRIGNRPYFYFVDDLESVDIDSAFDFEMANMLVKKYNKEERC
tara:strand:+ start:795 stop:1469 length:675 start_codon:yes stop_codon:yes gene_type:complete